MIIGVLTEMKVPGKKKRVMSVIILINTVSCLVFLAISLISLVMDSILSAES